MPRSAMALLLPGLADARRYELDYDKGTVTLAWQFEYEMLYDGSSGSMATLEADDLFVHDGGSVTCVRAPSQPYYVVRTCRRDAAAQAPSGVSSCSCLFHHNLESPPPQRHHPHPLCLSGTTCAARASAARASTTSPSP